MVGVLAVFVAFLAVPLVAGFVAPFYRDLALENPCMKGDDVLLLQNLLRRVQGTEGLNISGCFDARTSETLTMFQRQAGIGENIGQLDNTTASAVLRILQDDGYIDDNKPASYRGYLYKVVVPVHKNRSLESTATLYSSNGTALHSFVVRAHGKDYENQHGWPLYSTTAGLTQLAPGGNTPTGLFSFDLNSPEPIPREYGKWPVNRAVLGLEGNAKFLLPHLRNGILMHTGEWPHWKKGMPMPNSEGCLHASPSDIKTVADILVSIGVQIRENPFGKLPYPYSPQGLLSIYLRE